MAEGGSQLAQGHCSAYTPNLSVLYRNPLDWQGVVTDIAGPERQPTTAAAPTPRHRGQVSHWASRSPTGRAGGEEEEEEEEGKGRKRGWRESNCCDTGCTKALGVLQARASAATPPQRRHAQACPASKSRGARDDGEDNRGSHRGEHQITEDRGEPGTIEDRGSHRTEPHGTSLLLTLPAHLLPTEASIPPAICSRVAAD
ncbi:unnamed protein product [Prorocentrum cordatum]|uniref:Uncharacterized protein n=1 Tax=Prorocentrum cordatum TaxID=2364126 RepID=A0ABN9RMC9_9DINO|nr:unnamed protein product [Polarella glacialis]